MQGIRMLSGTRIMIERAADTAMRRFESNSETLSNPVQVMTKRELLDYEVAGSGWAQLISIGWIQSIAATHFARKVDRKYARWVRSQQIRAALKATGS